ncbi:MAG: hypothetical protein H7833_00460 [Magnetococcus sp. DMHC-1]
MTTKAGQDSKAGSKITITIQPAPDKNGNRPVPVGVNGSIMLIPRGKKVEVPAPYVEVLSNARQTVVEMDPDTGNVTESDILAYPFTVHSPTE